MTNLADRQLGWSLTIATYRRGYILPTCIRLACDQSRPPDEVVVVDASPDWKETRALVESQLSQTHPEIRLLYVAAGRASSAAQRNQAIDLASSDIVFMIDDDALMHPGCAAEIMTIYEADSEERIAGVQAILTTSVPAEVDQSAYADIRYDGIVDGSFGRSRNPLHRYGHKLLSAEDLIVKYDSAGNEPSLPAAVSKLAVARTEVLAGMRMTWRRRIIDQVRFEELLQRYAAYEDYDASLRASRHGLLLSALKAKICHLKSAGGGRLSRRDVAYISSINWAVLLRLNSDDPKRVEREYRRKLLKNAGIDLLRDMLRRRWRLPHFRGRVAGLRMLPTIFRRSPAELREWYRTYQETLFQE
jgi:GT2 family glycosyltransferase